MNGSCAWMPYSCAATYRPSPMRSRNADSQTDREQEQHFAHDKPDHEARLCTERKADAELLSSLRHDKSHHAVETDGSQQRGEESKSRRQHRDQSVREERLVELSFDGLHLVHGNRGIELPHFVAHERVGARRRRLRAHVKDRVVLAPIRNEHLASNPFSRALVQRIGHHADNLDRQLRVRAAAEPDALADRALPWKEVIGEAPIDDRHGRLFFASLLLKSRPSTTGIFIVSK